MYRLAQCREVIPATVTFAAHGLLATVALASGNGNNPYDGFRQRWSVGGDGSLLGKQEERVRYL
jgi:hypothetical protein